MRLLWLTGHSVRLESSLLRAPGLIVRLESSLLGPGLLRLLAGHSVRLEDPLLRQGLLRLLAGLVERPESALFSLRPGLLFCLCRLFCR